ncbi:MAG: hypothetical protein QOJ29_1839 [Thermoleophilaceae bacterium]|nr:hypothetical protein [Thermoleophilaceae bacterium]
MPQPPAPDPQPDPGGGDPPGVARKALHKVADKTSDSPFAVSIAWFVADVGALFVFLAISGKKADAVRDEKVLVGVAVVALITAAVLSFRSKQDGLSQARKRAWALAATAVYGVSLLCMVIAVLAASSPTSHITIGHDVNRNGKLPITVWGTDLSKNQTVVYRLNWDDDPQPEKSGDIERTAGGSDTDKTVILAGPVDTDHELNVIAFVHGAEDHPPKQFDCGGYDACLTRNDTLPGAVPPDLSGVERSADKLAFTVEQRAEARYHAIITLFDVQAGAGASPIDKREHRIDNAPYTDAFHLPVSTRGHQLCLVATFDQNAAASCDGRPASRQLVAP